jgi:hypothetical protein
MKSPVDTNGIEAPTVEVVREHVTRTRASP